MAHSTTRAGENPGSCIPVALAGAKMDKARFNGKAIEYEVSKTSIQRVIGLCLIWKLILLVVACASPGPGYDTSTKILLDQFSSPSGSRFGGAVEHVVLRLTRWDGIYFSSLAARGHVNEQEWAFSWALARTTSFVARGPYSPKNRLSCGQG